MQCVSHSSFTQCTGSLTRLDLGEETLEDGLQAADRELALLEVGSSALELVLGTVNDIHGGVLDTLELTLLEVYTVLATR